MLLTTMNSATFEASIWQAITEQVVHGWGPSSSRPSHRVSAPAVLLQQAFRPIFQPVMPVCQTSFRILSPAIDAGLAYTSAIAVCRDGSGSSNYSLGIAGRLLWCYRRTRILPYTKLAFQLILGVRFHTVTACSIWLSRAPPAPLQSPTTSPVAAWNDCRAGALELG